MSAAKKPGAARKASAASSSQAAQPGRLRRVAMTHQTVREIALALPGVAEGTSYGTPAFRVRGRFLARFHQDGESLVLVVDPELRDVLLEADPGVFYITEHYRNYPTVLVRIAKARREAVEDLLETTWRRHAPKRAVAAYDAERGGAVLGAKVSVTE